MTYNRKYITQLFAPEEGTIITADIEPAISIDHNNRLVSGIKTLARALGITDMKPMAAGTQIKLYRVTKTNSPAQVAEGETITLTKVERKLARTITLALNKYRKQTTAEAIQRSGYAHAVNDTDTKLLGEVRKDIKTTFFNTIKGGSGTAPAGANLQAALANLWGSLQTFYEDMDVTPVFFINPIDAAEYLGGAQITTQTAFGLTYIEGFLGLGNAFITSAVDQGAPVATVAQNLNGAFVPAGGDVARTFGLTFDASGLVGMKHYTADSQASIDTLIMSGAVFYAEDNAGVFVGSITQGNTEASESEGDQG